MTERHHLKKKKKPVDAGQAAPGTDVGSPLRMPFGGWLLVLKQTFLNLISTQSSLSASGCAFFATLSLFPAMTTLLSLYGLVFDINSVEPQLQVLRNLLPPAAFDLISDQIHLLIRRPHVSLTLGLILSLAFALWTTSSSTKSVLAALNIAHNVDETRGFLHYQFVSLGMTLLAVLGAALTLALMVALPAFVDYLPQILDHFGIWNLTPKLRGWALYLMSYGIKNIVHFGAPALMLLFIFVAVSLLFRYAPCREAPDWRWVLPGSLVATMLWVLTSLGFSYYVAHFASYGATYGSLGAVAAVMMWFFVSTYVVLFGAQLNIGLQDRDKGREPAVPGGPREDEVQTAKNAAKA